MEPAMMIFWVVATICLAVIEAATVNLVTIWFAIGALFAALAARLGASLPIQIGVFVIVSALALVLTRPFLKKLKAAPPVATNADRIVGKTGKVTVKIDPIGATGQIEVLGAVWSAQSADGSPIEAERAVRVIGIKGVKAVVKEEKA